MISFESEKKTVIEHKQTCEISDFDEKSFVSNINKIYKN